MTVPQPPIMPRRPGWVATDEIAYRSRIFRRFRGCLTYGSPLEKFAGLWPALVPINRERIFRPNIPWLNIMTRSIPFPAACWRSKLSRCNAVREPGTSAMPRAGGCCLRT